MPVVQTYGTPTQTSNVMQDYQRVNADPAAFGAPVGQALQTFGQAIEKPFDMYAQHALKMKQQDDENAANKADISFMQRMADLQYNTDPDKGDPGLYTLKGAEAYQKGPDGKSAYDKYMANLSTARDEIRNTLPAGDAQRLFDQLATKRIGGSIEAGAAHVAKERQMDMINTSNARIEAQIQQVALNPYDPKNWADAKAIINDEIAKQSHNFRIDPNAPRDEQGNFIFAPGTPQAIQQQKLLDKAVHDSAMRIMTTQGWGPVQAMDYITANQKNISPEMQTELTSKLKPTYDATTAKTAVDSIMNGQPRPNTNLVDAVVKVESGGNRNAVSPKGAKSEMQVMDATNRDPGYGVKPAQNDSLEERARVGRDYLQAMLQKYGGNQTAALAAYNAGPDKVDKALKKIGASPNGAINEQQLLSMMPAETQAYVAKINQLAPPTPGTPPTSKDVMDHYQDMQAQVRQIAEQMRPGDIQFRETMLSQLQTQVGHIDQGQRIADKQNAELLMQSLIGPNKVSSMEELLADPARANAYIDLYKNNPQSILHLQEMIKTNAKNAENVPPTADNQALWYGLLGKASTDTEGFVNTDLNQYYGKLPLQQWQHLVGIQAGINKKDLAASAKQVNLKRAMSLVSGELAGAGLDPRSKDEKVKQKIDIFAGQLEVAMDNMKEAANGKNPDDESIKNAARQLLTQGALKGSGYFSETKLPQFMANEQQNADTFYVPADKIPKDRKIGMVNMWKQYFGGKEPDDATLSFWATVGATNVIPKKEQEEIRQRFQTKYSRQPSSLELSMVYVANKRKASKPAASVTGQSVEDPYNQFGRMD